MQKTQYCFILNNQFCSLAERKGDQYTYMLGFEFDQKNQLLQKEQLTKQLDGLNLPIFQADEISVAWVTENSCLLPSSVYDNSMAKDFYLTCFSEIKPQYELDFNRISNLSLVNIYEIPLWVKSFFVVRFPRVVVQHHQTIALKASVEKNSYLLQIHVSIFSDMMSINIIEKNEVVFTNSFQVNHQNDLIYYVSFTIQQLNLELKKGKLTFSIHPLVNFCSEEDLLSNLDKISLFQSFEINFDALQPFKFQQFCV